MLGNKTITARFEETFGVYEVWGYVIFNIDYISTLDIKFLTNNERVGYSEYSIIDGIKVLDSSQEEHKDSIQNISEQILEYFNTELKNLFNTI